MSSNWRISKLPDGSLRLEGLEDLSPLGQAQVLLGLPLITMQRRKNKISPKVLKLKHNMKADGVSFLAPRPVDIEELVALAKEHDESAHRFLVELSSHKLAYGEPLGKRLSEFIVEKLNGQFPERPRGRKKDEHLERDSAIKVAVEHFVKRGFPKNGAPESACSIVSEALLTFGVLLSEDGVRKAANRADNQVSIELFQELGKLADKARRDREKKV